MLERTILSSGRYARIHSPAYHLDADRDVHGCFVSGQGTKPTV